MPVTFLVVVFILLIHSFQHLSESRLLPGALHRRSMFANFSYDLMLNRLS